MFSLAILATVVFLASFPTQSDSFGLNVAAFQQRLNTDPTFRMLYEEHMKNFPKSPSDGVGYTAFNCTGGVSATVPTSVHALRPGDIKVIGAMGDSWTAANGAGATNPAEMALTYRGFAATIGGHDNLELRGTIPNILKKFNPHLFGYSTGIGASIEWPVAYLNTAEPGNKAHHLPDQAHVLIQRMRNHPNNIDMANDWKLINIFIGGNDICGYCGDPVGMGAESFIGHIKDTLNILRDNIPRVLVNVVGVPHVELVRKIDAEHILCRIVHDDSECKCLGSNLTDSQLGAVTDSMNRKWDELLRNATFDTTDDFSVIVQPVLNDQLELPRTSDGKVDMSYFTPDCFHLTGKGHSMWAFGIWSSMMQPLGQKPSSWDMSNPNVQVNLPCPDPACPFIRTTKNSANCQQYLSPPKKQ